MKEIISVNNPLIKQLSQLKDKKNILEYGYTFVEGESLVLDLVKNNKVDILLIEQTKFNKLSQHLINFDISKVYLITDIIAKKISQTISNPGIFAVVKLPQKSTFDKSEKFIVLDNVQDPTNLGAIIRSARAFGFSQIILINSVFAYLPKVIRSSMGYVFDVRVFNYTFEELKGLVESNSLNLIVADMNGQSITSYLPPKVYGIVVGNEGQGISNDIKLLASDIVKIDMKNNVESLNVAVSASVFMHHLTQK